MEGTGTGCPWSGGIPIPEAYKKCGCGFWGHGLVVTWGWCCLKVELILKIFSNQNNSVVLWFYESTLLGPGSALPSSNTPLCFLSAGK